MEPNRTLVSGTGGDEGQMFNDSKEPGTPLGLESQAMLLVIPPLEDRSPRGPAGAESPESLLVSGASSRGHQPETCPERPTRCCRNPQNPLLLGQSSEGVRGVEILDLLC